MILRWFLSKTFRQATDLRKQVRAVLESQRDLLSPDAIREVQTGLRAMAAALANGPSRLALETQMTALEQVANRWLKPYPNASWRENVKEFLVSAVLVLGIFNFFLQPMKIPSGSAQPTLYGNVVTDLALVPGAEFPGRWTRFVDWFRGIDYHRWVAKDSGTLRLGRVETTFGFIKSQRFSVGNDGYTLFWPPEQLDRAVHHLLDRPVARGELALHLRVSSGDRLFVDRFTYNFRRPQRGEIIVFSSAGTDDFLRPHRGPNLIPNTHYIKRLIGLPGDRVRIGDDRHVVINGQRLDASTPHFEYVYTFDPDAPPRDSVYSGHVNEAVAAKHRASVPAEFFPNGHTEFVVRDHYYLPFGDNTMNSYDGRAWGDFPEWKVIGRAGFVFWPLTRRFGLITH